MPQRVCNTVEKNVVSVPTVPVVVPSNTPTMVLPDVTKDTGEYSGRAIQNVGANDCYYSYGHTCDPTNFIGIMSKPGTLNAAGFGSGQQFNASDSGQAVWVYSTGGTTIAVTILKRNDLTVGLSTTIGTFQ
jgi:hypothetical protein